ncbi:MAG: ABC transporter permease [Acidimicrobiales bacterium]|nr:ABC transporter permease [Acidimicrobiales bacterium]
MVTPLEDAPLVDVSTRPSLPARVRALWRSRELLANLVRKELKVRYKDSVLGFLWTLLNPLLYLVVFSLVFAEIIRVDVPVFGVFLLSGLLAWNLLSAGVSGGAASIVANAPLVQKVRFSREVLPIAVVGAAVVNFGLQLVVLVAGMAVLRHPPDLAYLPVLAAAFVVLVLLTTSLAIGLSAINVSLRDTGHFVELGLLAWFWMSAIVYPYHLVADRLGDLEWLTLLNPMVPVVTAFQRTLYNPDAAGVVPIDVSAWWYLARLGVVVVISLVILAVSVWAFARLEDDFAEEI